MLLILAAITINLVFSQNGIIAKAKEADLETRGGAVEEARDLWRADRKVDKYGTVKTAQTLDELLNSLESQKKITSEEKTIIQETGTVTIGSKTIDFDTARTLVELYDSGELKIGDYVNYENPQSGTYTSLGTKTGMSSRITGGNTDQVFNVANNQLNWRVLGKDEATGGVKLIAGSPMKREKNATIEWYTEITDDPYYSLYGANGYLNSEEELNNISNLYKNEYAQNARSVNMKDINEITGITTDEKIKEANLNPVHEWKQYGESYSIADSYTPETWLNGKTKTTVEGTVTGYYYSINDTTSEDPTVTLSDSRKYDMLFKNVNYGQGRAYWLASRGVNADSDNARVARLYCAYFGPGAVYAGGSITYAGTGNLFDSHGYELGSGFAVRPVIILKSDVTEEGIHKIEDKTETDWNYDGGLPPPPQ